MDLLHKLQNWEPRIGVFLLAAVMIRQAMSMPFTRYCPLEATPLETARWEDPCSVAQHHQHIADTDNYLKSLVGDMSDLAEIQASYRYSHTPHYYAIKAEMEPFRLKGMPERSRNFLVASAVKGDAYVDLATVTYYLTVFHRKHDIVLYNGLELLANKTVHVLCALSQTMDPTEFPDSRIREISSMNIPCQENDEAQLHKMEYVMLRDSYNVIETTRQNLRILSEL